MRYDPPIMGFCGHASKRSAASLYNSGSCIVCTRNQFNRPRRSHNVPSLKTTVTVGGRRTEMVEEKVAVNDEKYALVTLSSPLSSCFPITSRRP